jgi:transposase
VGLENVAQTEKSASSENECESDVDRFFYVEGVVHHEFLPQGQTVNRWYYLDVLKRLRDRISRKRPQLWRNNSWILHHDNAPAHTSLLIRDFLAQHETTVLPQPPYSPDLAPADFFLFQKLKATLRKDEDSIGRGDKGKIAEDLRAIPKNAFQDCFRKWEKRWERCMNSQGEYFEGAKTE